MGLLTLALHGPSIFKILNRYECNKFSGVCQDFFWMNNGGGVWKTDDYGCTWKPIFDEAPTGSVGDIAVSPSQPEVIYVGTGEGLHRPDLSVGDGIFKSRKRLSVCKTNFA